MGSNRRLLGALAELLASAVAASSAALHLDQPVLGGDVLHLGWRRRAALAVAAEEVRGAGGGRRGAARRGGGRGGSLEGCLAQVLGRRVVRAAHGAQLAQGRAGSAVGVLEVAVLLGAVGTEQVAGVVAQTAARKAGRGVVVEVEVRRPLGAGRAAGTVALLPVVGPRGLRRALGLAIAQAEVLVQPFGHRLSRSRPQHRCALPPAPRAPAPLAARMEERGGGAGRAGRPAPRTRRSPAASG